MRGERRKARAKALPETAPRSWTCFFADAVRVSKALEAVSAEGRVRRVGIVRFERV